MKNKQIPIGKKILNEVTSAKRRSKDWFANRLYDELEKVQDKVPDLDAVCGVVPDNLYFFTYNAKYAKQLKYWDTRPLVYVIQLLNGGFYGYNLHYVNPTFRKVIAKSLKANNSTGFAPEECFHQYLCTGLLSYPVKVPKDSWESVAFLPTENFIDKDGQPVASSSVWSI